MIEKNRSLVGLLQKRLAEPHPLIQVLVGPRQVGKTTALKSALAGRGLYQTADSPLPLSSNVITKWWTDAQGELSPILAIDEIQKINGWAEVIKKLWDENLNTKLVITGSSALLVEKGLTESLAGRFELIRAEHWNYKEAKEIFNLSLREYTEMGCYPGAERFRDDKQRWAEYIRDSIVEPAIGRDLLQLHPVDSPALLRQVMGVAVSLPAQIISFQKIQGVLQNRGAVSTIKHYLHLLSQAFLVSAIDKFSPSSFRTKQSSPKLITHDNALLRAFERPVEGALSDKKFGRYLENLVGARFIEAGWETYYWKHREEEVDFVVVGPRGERWAIEVKSGGVKSSDLRGVRNFCNQFPEFEPCLLSLREHTIKDLRSLSIEEVLSLSRI